MSLCYGCYSCEVACKQEHNLPPGPRLIRVTRIGPKKIGGKLVMDFYPSHCFHCGKPKCAEACPEGAITKRTDGIVLFNENLCTGCKLCIEACPFGAPQFNAEKNIVQNCDLCATRLEEGLAPACVHHCPTGAIFFGDANLFQEELRKRRAVATSARFTP